MLVTDDDATGRLSVSWLASDHVDPDQIVRLVAEFAGIPAADVQIVHACRSCGSDQHGKPQVVMPPGAPQLHVSVSRSGGRTVAAVTDAGPVGVDVETFQPSSDDLVAWVRTESLVKATGHGLTIDPAQLDDEPRWTVDLDAPEGFVAAVTILTDAPAVTTVPAAPEA